MNVVLEQNELSDAAAQWLEKRGVRPVRGEPFNLTVHHGFGDQPDRITLTVSVERADAPPAEVSWLNAMYDNIGDVFRCRGCGKEADGATSFASEHLNSGCLMPRLQRACSELGDPALERAVKTVLTSVRRPL